MLAEVIGRDILSGIAKGVGLFLGEVFVGVVEGVDKKRREEDERKEREYQLRVADLNERQERLTIIAGERERRFEQMLQDQERISIYYKEQFDGLWEHRILKEQISQELDDKKTQEIIDGIMERLKEEDEPDDERSDSDEDHSDASPGS